MNVRPPGRLSVQVGRFVTVAWSTPGERRRPRGAPYYGWFRGVYGLQFHNEGTFYPQALPHRKWRTFKDFLFTTFPERKAAGSIGSRLFQWPWKK